MTEAVADGPDDEGENIWTSYNTRDRVLLTVGCVISYWIFSLVARLFDYPRYPGYEASLLVQPSPIVMLLMTLIVLVACVLLTSFFAGLVHFEGGLFCACVGMVALSTHGGAMRYVLMYHPGGGTFLRLLVELILLFIFAGIGWIALGVLRDAKLLRGEPHVEEDPDAIPAQGAMALLAQVILMCFLMLILAQTDKKAQVIWSVAASSCLAALAAHSLFPSRPSVWFWTTPLIVGVIGYILAAMADQSLPGGAVGGFAPALARPLPLDYASVGVAGSLLGYWTSRRWQHERDHEPEEPQEVEDALEHPPQNA